MYPFHISGISAMYRVASLIAWLSPDMTNFPSLPSNLIGGPGIKDGASWSARRSGTVLLSGTTKAAFVGFAGTTACCAAALAFAASSFWREIISSGVRPGCGLVFVGFMGLSFRCSHVHAVV